MARNIIITESQFKRLITEALAIEPYLDEIWRISQEICGLFSKRPDPSYWTYMPNLFGLGPAYIRFMGKISDVPIYATAFENEDNYFDGGYVEEAEVIFVTPIESNNARAYFETLAHELTHHIDLNRAVSVNTHFNSLEMEADEKLPEEFFILLYYLWDNTEFNAHQTLILRKDYNTIKEQIYFLKKAINRLQIFTSNHPIWQYIGSKYLGMEGATGQKVRKYFITKTEKLLKKFEEKVYRKFSKYSADDNRFVAESVDAQVN